MRTYVTSTLPANKKFCKKFLVSKTNEKWQTLKNKSELYINYWQYPSNCSRESGISIGNHLFSNDLWSKRRYLSFEETMWEVSAGCILLRVNNNVINLSLSHDQIAQSSEVAYPHACNYLFFSSRTFKQHLFHLVKWL